MRLFLYLLLTAGAAFPASQAPLTPAAARPVAPQFALKDASGETVQLQTYRGKVVLLDFWATWCTGCKEEIPSFVRLQQIYGPRGFAVIGVSLDEKGWAVLKPFLAEYPIPYPMLLGDQPTAHRYAIESLPDTFLIDRKGRIAAAYRATLVDPANVESNVQSLLAQR
jgi:peroxiredoxin